MQEKIADCSQFESGELLSRSRPNSSNAATAIPSAPLCSYMKGFIEDKAKDGRLIIAFKKL